MMVRLLTHIFGTWPQNQFMLAYYWLKPRKQISVTSSDMKLLDWNLFCWHDKTYIWLIEINWRFGLSTSRGHFKNTYELLNLRALWFSHVNEIYIFQCMGKIFCVEFQRYPFKFHTKYLFPYIERYDFYKNKILAGLRAHMRFWNVPQSHL